jgi:hypothetical protein
MRDRHPALRRRIELNLHFHTLLLDGVFYAPGEGDTLDFRPLPPPTDDEVGVVLARIAVRVQRLLRRRGLDPGDADLSQADPVVEESPVLAGISSASSSRPRRRATATIPGRSRVGGTSRPRPAAARRCLRKSRPSASPWQGSQNAIA